MNYYTEIKDKLIDVEVTERVNNYNTNRVKLENYYEIGRLLIEAQGGEENAKYGNSLIKEYAIRLTTELGKGYSWRNLYNMRSFYLLLFHNEKLQALPAKLSWTHFIELLTLKDYDAVNYYIDLCIKLNLNYRELHKRIKNREYENLSDIAKQKIIENKELSLPEKIPNPIIIDNLDNKIIVKEKELHKLIMSQLPKFLSRLGEGYAYIGDEYPIKIGNKNNYIDFLLYNRKYRSFVVIELKIRDLKKEDIGQIELYMNYVDKNIKDITDTKTIGIILGVKDNDLIMQYCSDDRVVFREFVLN